MKKLHEGHQGVKRSRIRTKSSVWWPCVTSQVKEFVENCRECAKESQQRKEPLIPTPLPDYPWQMVGSNLFQLGGEQYLLVVDYYSRYSEVVRLPSTTSTTVIKTLKTIFSRHGIPEVLRSDNGPQYSSVDSHATPLPWCGLSPSELCMGRRIRTTVPQTKVQLHQNLL